MRTARTVTSLAITLAAAATLSIAGCKKQATTPPQGLEEPADEPDESAAETEDEPDDEAVLDKASFDETIHEHFGDVSDCYVAALANNPDLAGKLDAEFKISTEGKVLSITAHEGSTLQDEGLLACINEAASHWEFARPPHGETTLRYTYNLAPGG